MPRTVEIERVERAPSPTPLAALLLKHGLDRLVAAGGLLVTAPLIAGVALALRLRGGPVLQREPRVGERGRLVMVRSFAVPDDWRLLVALGVPALPQLWSIVTGHMSLVGPRPRELGFEAPPARPGMTGLAQLERCLTLAEQLELDERYAREWSLGLDARILWRTLSSGGGRTAQRP